MANRKRAPREVEERHKTLIAAAAAELYEKRQEAWQAELRQRRLIKNAFNDDVTVGPIKEATISPDFPEGMSTPRLYQIKHEELDVPEEQTA